MSELRGLRALVTGASSGIGAAIARTLAEHGVNLVLTGRNRAALDEVAQACRGRAVDVTTVISDLGATTSAVETLWQAATAERGIDILINNAGFGYFRRFHEADLSRDRELVQLNVTSLVDLTRLFVEARAGRTEPAFVVNIASIAAYQSVPNFAVYAASKAFVRNFTEALHDELVAMRSPISATCICPGGTHTAFHATAGAGDYSWLANRSMLTAEAVARGAIHAMRKRKRTVVMGLLNKLSCFGVRFVPRRVASWLSGRVLGKPRGALPARTAPQ